VVIKELRDAAGIGNIDKSYARTMKRNIKTVLPGGCGHGTYCITFLWTRYFRRANGLHITFTQEGEFTST
jgi:hypothetical protein